jgi:phosphate transport system ATP-binding protein
MLKFANFFNQEDNGYEMFENNLNKIPKQEHLQIKAEVKSLNFFYGAVQALKSINMPIAEKKVTALIGPSGCGKSTLLRCFNRMHDLYKNTKYDGQILLHPEGLNLISKSLDSTEIRLRVGMVFQKPNPFPKSIFENVAFGLRLRGISGLELDSRVELALKQAALWHEVSSRLKESAIMLSGGQQQRLCIARALAVEPEIVLFDEPTSALDPVATSKIEDLMTELKERLTVLVVTHNMQQASRVSDYTGFMYLGELVEFDRTENIFMRPKNKLTENYVAGHFG